MPSDIAKLRALAEATTQPHPWTVRVDNLGPHEVRHVVVDRDNMWVADCGHDEEQAVFIAAASPGVVLALLDEIERLQRMREAAIAQLHYDMDEVVSDTPANLAAKRIAALIAENDRLHDSLTAAAGYHERVCVPALAALTAARDELAGLLIDADRGDSIDRKRMARVHELRKVGAP